MKNAVVVFLTALILGPVPALTEICSDPDPLACDPIAFFTKANSAPDIVIGPGPPDVTFYSTQNFLATSTAGPWNLNHLEFQNNSGITLTDLVFSFSGVLDMTGLAIPPLFSCPEGGAAGVNSAGWFELPCPVIESVTRVGTTRDYVVSGSFTWKPGHWPAGATVP